MMVWFVLWSCDENDCSIYTSASVLLDAFLNKPFSTVIQYWNFPQIINQESVIIWFSWLILQVSYFEKETEMNANKKTINVHFSFSSFFVCSSCSCSFSFSYIPI